MKRSEMLNLIRTLNSSFTSGVASFEEEEEHAEYILKKIEKAGMLPPVNYKLNRSTILAGEASEWEPEDEKD